ncbi:helix-turn-helix domain-containing protein [Tindallia californiensis]|uniref:Helix-turn-helix n=1 Tax=Tindallia californiensis TaxID=159292 RepID=A0A1H3QZ85_9FIRM|nr:helix-turn-helix transcriptional regulator [Tindallia californiensis]SDZ18892.1 Helix-turn-helix [Tindallia californiensis]
MNDHFIKVIKKERLRQGLSARALGFKAGITGRAITYYESGQRFPKLEHADRLLKALGITMVIGGSLNEK